MRIKSKNALFALCFTASSGHAQENCGYSLSLAQSGFEAGEQPQYVELPPQNTPLSLTLTYPTEGALIPHRSLQVHGTFTGPANTGITINGNELATTNATQFTTHLIVLEPGPQTLTVTASTLDGATQTITRNITVSPELGEDVRLLGRSAGNYAPLRIGFELRVRFPAGQTQLTRLQMDYEGDGSFELDTTDANVALSHFYDAAGVYPAKARLTFDDGDAGTPPVVRESVFHIHMEVLAYTRQLLCDVYYEMKHRLQDNQPGSALNTLSPKIRPQFQTLWASMGAGLPAIADSLGEIVQGKISDISADLTVALADPQRPGEFLGFPVLFTRSADGVWRISGM